MKKTALIITVLTFCTTLFSQARREPPISFETLFGDQRVALTLSFNKPIAGQFRYNNITSAAAYYDYNAATRNLGRTELVSVNSIIYQFHPRVGASAGMQYHFVKGLIPSLAVHFSYANPEWLLVFTPYYNFRPWSNLETIGIVEFKPALNDRLRLFSRLQGFYGYDFNRRETERGMLYLRLGVSWQKYTVGVGSNFDFYRPAMRNIQNHGGFLRIDI